MSKMETKPNISNANGSLIVDGTGTVTGPDPPPLAGTTDTNTNNNDDEQTVTTTTTTLVATGPSIVPLKAPEDEEGYTGRGQQQYPPHHGGTVGASGTARSGVVNSIRILDEASILPFLNEASTTGESRKKRQPSRFASISETLE